MEIDRREWEENEITMLGVWVRLGYAFDWDGEIVEGSNADDFQ